MDRNSRRAQFSLSTTPVPLQPSEYFQNYKPPTGAVPTTNTHHYDGALPMNSDLGLLIQRIRQKIDTSDYRALVITFVEDIKLVNIPEKNDVSMQFLNQTLQSWSQDANYDRTNTISADEILVVCAEIWNNMSVVKPDLLEAFAREFFSQFMDMQTGPCPQGRTIRLWQVAITYVQWHKDFYVPSTNAQNSAEFCDQA